MRRDRKFFSARHAALAQRLFGNRRDIGLLGLLVLDRRLRLDRGLRRILNRTRRNRLQHHLVDNMRSGFDKLRDGGLLGLRIGLLLD